ncbi:MAG TPA: ATP phosphoribosyltransferase regulatory subunit [Clostridiaceae bacterium]|nr:ATP phosphoribosyltransferase regulatory subunit [Clostridiaceae bacterium]
MKWKYHTPDGFSDLMPKQCEAKKYIESALRRLFKSAGYDEVYTPGFEFADVYAADDELGDLESLFKTFDPQGRILASRFDGTVGVARLAATKMTRQPLPLRLSYIEDMYRYKPAGESQLKEFTQAGLELIGSDQPTADGEIIAMAIQAARICGISQIHVAVGQVDFFKSMLEEWELTGEPAHDLVRMIDRKEILAIETFCDRYELSDGAKQVLNIVLESMGSYDQLAALESLINNKRGRRALQNLREILDYLADRDLLQYVSLDLGMLQSLNYYTGMIFKGYTYALGTPLFSGGRYDQVTKNFGSDWPATGFSLSVDEALTAVERQNKCHFGTLPEKTGIAYASGYRRTALLKGKTLRDRGDIVVDALMPMTKEEAGSWAQEQKLAKLYFIDNNMEDEQQSAESALEVTAVYETEEQDG